MIIPKNKNFSYAELIRANQNTENLKFVLAVYLGKQITLNTNDLRDTIREEKQALKEWLKNNSFDNVDDEGYFTDEEADKYYDLKMFLDRHDLYKNKKNMQYYINLFMFWYPYTYEYNFNYYRNEIF